ncbi:MAG: hypothetical protein ABI386_11750 [Rhodanobacter sp.]
MQNLTQVSGAITGWPHSPRDDVAVGQSLLNAVRVAASQQHKSTFPRLAAGLVPGVLQRNACQPLVWLGSQTDQ